MNSGSNGFVAVVFVLIMAVAMFSIAAPAMIQEPLTPDTLFGSPTPTPEETAPSVGEEPLVIMWVGVIVMIILTAIGCGILLVIAGSVREY
ncbi:MAG: hypothetical protein SVM80_00195 [Halobacteriota archaeon]|nr:hypothetical protein [Halobacteriota archaeon]